MGGYKKIAAEGLSEFGAVTVSLLLSRPTVRSGIRGLLRKVFTGSREKPYQEVPAVERTSDSIIRILSDNGVKPTCLGIDGIAGGGKSTLGRSLSKKLGLKWRTLFARELARPVQLEEGNIYENIRMNIRF